MAKKFKLPRVTLEDVRRVMKQEQEMQDRLDEGDRIENEMCEAFHQRLQTDPEFAAQHAKDAEELFDLVMG